MSKTPILVGRKLGPYAIEAVLGEGAMAVVYRAIKTGAMSFRKTIALKVVRPEHAHDQAYIDSLIDEARVGGILSHPNIVQILEFECIDGIYCIAMEYVDGVTLRQAMRSPGDVSLSPGQALRIAIDVCQGLAYAHSALDERGKPLNLVHRDLKPSNIMLARQGQAKILDFGLARTDIERMTTKTSTGVIKGTPLYMSPEQVLSQSIDTRSDVFSLCSVLGELIIKEKVFKGSSVFEVISAIATGQSADAVEKVRIVSPALASILERGWSVERDERQRSAEVLCSELTGVLSEFDETRFDDLVARCIAAIPAPAIASQPVSSSQISVVDTMVSQAVEGELGATQKDRIKLSKKICMLGSFGVGKTSLVGRFVRSMFSEKYLTTVGVKIDKKTVEVNNTELTMVLWDVHGDDKLRKVKASHLKGASGYVLVVDGTRRSSFDTALEMKERLAEAIDGLSFIVAINKSDLRDAWEISERDIEELRSRNMQVVMTSAKSGDGVEEMFHDLARMLVS